MASISPTDRTRAEMSGALDTLVEMLRTGGEDEWVRLVSEAAAAWRERSDISPFLGLFGGMGSLNDTVPSLPGAGWGSVPTEELANRSVWYAAAMGHLLTATYFMGLAARDGKRFAAGGTISLPYEAWHVRLDVCPSCLRVNLRPKEIEVWVANRLTWQTARALYPLGRLSELKEFDRAAAGPVAEVLRGSVRKIAAKQGWGLLSVATPARVDRPLPGGGVSFEQPPEKCPYCDHAGLQKAEARISGPPDALETLGRSEQLWGDNGPGDLGMRVAATFGPAP